RPKSIASSHHNSVAQIRQECNELKCQNTEHLKVIAKQTAELEHLRSQVSSSPFILSITKENGDSQKVLEDLEKRNQETSVSLAQKEAILESKEKEIQELLKKMDVLQGQTSLDENGFSEKRTEHSMQLELAEKEKLLSEKEQQLRELQLQWQTERAELTKPALEQVTKQLEELKETNRVAVERLNEKEGELAELRSQLNRRDRKPKPGGAYTQDHENQRRLKRLTMDLENDRLLIQKLEDLNAQFEIQKQKHEATLRSHAEVIAEKDRELVEREEALKNLKRNHDNAVKALERNQKENLENLQAEHTKDLDTLSQRLKLAEKQKKTVINDEVERILQEFEQSEHNHSVQVANLQMSYQEQINVMRKGQQNELKSFMSNKSSPQAAMDLKLRKTGGPSTKLRWPAMSPPTISLPELRPRNSKEVHVYISSVSGNQTIKQQQEDIFHVLDEHKVDYKVIDVAQSEVALQHMRKQSCKTRTLPQIFIGGTYRGQHEDMKMAVNQNKLESFLGENNKENDDSKNSYLPSPLSTPP
ncbi:hypothetical protein K501DRAFT_142577, partial [Backusella circina FSU 941]